MSARPIRLRADVIDDVAVDTLVASYSAIGKAHGRSRRRHRVLSGFAVVLASALVVAGVRFDWSRLQFQFGNDLGAVTELRALVTAELEQLGEQRSELEAQRRWFEARRAEMTRQLSAFERQTETLEAQRLHLENQGLELAAAMAAIDEQTRVLLAAENRRPSLEQEIAAIATERRTLEERWREFSVEDDELGEEIDSLNRQRQALEAQRNDMEQQRRELEALLEQAGLGAALVPPTAAMPAEEPPLPAADMPTVAPLLSPETLAFAAEMVEDQSLADMRAGVRLGDGMSISLGVTRTANINGVEQIQNSIQLDNLQAGFDASAFDGLGSLVIQNGTGNEIGAGVLDSLSTGFGTVIQNSLDDQTIGTEMIYDLQIQDVSQAINGLAADHALTDSLSFQQ